VNSDARLQPSRRAFLRAAAAALATPFALPGPGWARAGAAPPNSRFGLALIGTGRQAFHANLLPFLASPDTQVVAVCDVDTWRLEQTHRKVEDYYAATAPAGTYRGCFRTRDFREILARPDVDAVMISTPDHWHAVMAVAAARAGKDVALEKPLTLCVTEGRAISDAMTRHGRMFRTDTEVRSSGEFRLAAELVRNGRIGRIRAVHAGVPKEQPPLAVPPATPVPADLDYELWQGPAVDRPYSEPRVHPCLSLTRRPGWMQIQDYSLGMILNWGTHLIDIVQWALDTERTGPVEVQGRGVFPAEGLYDVLQDFTVHYRYASGVTLDYGMAGRPYLRFEGTDGWIEAEWWKGVTASKPEILKARPGPGEVSLPLSNEKLDFIQSVKTRKESLIPAEVGHRTATICQLGWIAIQTGTRLTWDPAAERFTNSDAANRLLTRPLRAPWSLGTAGV
jgi:predicted dehydrogenase